MCSLKVTSLPSKLLFFCFFFFRCFGKYLGFRLSFLLSFHTMEELASRWNNFSLSEKEKANYTISKEQRFGEFILAAEFLTPCFLKMESMARTFKQLW